MQVRKTVTWEEFIEQRGAGWREAMLMQAIVTLSTQPQFENMIPEEIFEHIDRTRSRYDGEIAEK